MRGVKTFKDKMQENRVRSRVCIISKRREASPETPTRRMDRGDAASTDAKRLPDPADVHRDGGRPVSEEVWIIPARCLYDPVGPRQVCMVVASWLLATVHLAHPDADFSEDRYGD